VLLDAGTATFTTSSLTIGTHEVLVAYAGDGIFKGTTNSLPSAQVISTVAKAQNYTWVLNSSGVGGDNIPDFLYSNGAYDLTEEVIKQLNANAPEEPLKTTAPEGKPPNPEKAKK
jgi:hypothetical protein